MLIAIIAGLLGFGIIYGFVLFCQAKSHIETAPKDDMYLCPKHGALPLSATININTDEYEFQTETGESTRGKVPYCPICLEGQIKKAKEQYGEKV